MKMTTANILVVEDDLLMRPLVELLVRQADTKYNVEWAENAKQAEKLLEKKVFEVAIIDIYLDGEKAGLELWRRARKKYPKTKFIIMSGTSLVDFLKEIRWPEGFVPFLEKPLNNRNAQLVLKKILKQNVSTKRS